ncbi:hypothetical protein C8J57DRAFT_615680 [Mycena rebaudengoi]|nr:hypothetical protein C8J57DRAFT_615680 [Mycena rebaudengoi]
MRSIDVPVFSLGFLIFFWACVPRAAAQANRTVDDDSPLIQYSPASAVTHSILTGFEQNKLYNGTVALMNSSSSDTVNMTLRFTGSAIWIFMAKPQTDPDAGAFATEYNIFVDGLSQSHSFSLDQSSDAEYADLAFSNETMPLGPHTIEMSIPGGAIAYFDYAVFRSNDPKPETTIPPIFPSSSSASQTSTQRSDPTRAPPTTQNSAHSSGKPLLVPIIGAAAGAVVLIILGITGVILCRRRARRRGLAGSNSPRPLMLNEDPPLPYSQPIYRERETPSPMGRIRSVSSSQPQFVPVSASPLPHYPEHGQRYPDQGLHRYAEPSTYPMPSQSVPALPSPPLPNPHYPQQYNNYSESRLPYAAQSTPSEHQHGRPEPLILYEKNVQLSPPPDSTAMSTNFGHHPWTNAPADSGTAALAEEMRALRVHVMRLETQQGHSGSQTRPDSGLEEMPPAYI